MPVLLPISRHNSILLTIETLRKYLNTLNYTVEITVREPESGLIVDTVSLSP